jgi:hypothetical protein
VSEDDADRGSMASLSRLAVRRHDPRWEPGALAAHAGICAGGGEQLPSLPRRVRFQRLGTAARGGGVRWRSGDFGSGGLLLRHTDRALGLIERVAACVSATTRRTIASPNGALPGLRAG